MHQALDLFTDDDPRKITQAVQNAEARTTAEIMPVVADSSGRYDRAEDVVGVWMALALLALTWWVTPSGIAEIGRWGTWPGWLTLVFLLAAVVIGFVGGSILGGRVSMLRRLFTPPQQMEEEVLARARQVFYDQRVHHTQGGSGVLVYVSLYERSAALIGDQAVLDKLGKPALEELQADLTAGLRSSRAAEAMTKAIKTIGNRLATVLPSDSNRTNQLSDVVVLIDHE